MEEELPSARRGPRVRARTAVGLAIASLVVLFGFAHFVGQSVQSRFCPLGLPLAENVQKYSKTSALPKAHMQEKNGCAVQWVDEDGDTLDVGTDYVSDSPEYW